MRVISRAVFLLFFIKSSCFFSQIPDSSLYQQDFIKLKTGELISGQDLTIQSSFFRTRKKIILDGKSYAPWDISFYNTNRILYGHFKPGHGFYVPLAVRIKGVNFFQGTHESTGGKNSAFISYYYSKGLNEVKRLKTNNLAHDLTDDPVVHKQLKSAVRAGNTSIISFVASVLFASPLTHARYGGSASPVFLALPVAGVINGIVFQFIRKRRTQHALIQFAPALPKYQPKFFTWRQRRIARKLSDG